jgi:hypothetical protein
LDDIQGDDLEPERRADLKEVATQNGRAPGENDGGCREGIEAEWELTGLGFRQLVFRSEIRVDIRRRYLEQIA